MIRNVEYQRKASAQHRRKMKALKYGPECVNLDMRGHTGPLLGSVRHGHTRNRKPSPTFNTWCAMRQRCYNPNNERYPNYGARGIRVCARWMDNFENFLVDMGERPPGTTLDRKDRNGNYEPKNCQWSNHERQANDRSSNRRITYSGQTKTVADWARELGLKYCVLASRLDRNWPLELAMQSGPVKRFQKRIKVPYAKHRTCPECKKQFVAHWGERNRFCSRTCSKRYCKREWFRKNSDRNNAHRRAKKAAQKAAKST